MKTSNRLFRIIAGLCIGLMALTSCGKEDPIDIDNNEYELFVYTYVPSFVTQTSITKEQEATFKMFSDIYLDKMKSVPGYTAMKEDGFFKVQGKTLYGAIEVVDKHFAGIQDDFNTISQNAGFDIMSKIDFVFIVQIGYIASDGTIATFYEKMYGEEYFTYDPSYGK